jgi:hypothetical protein
MTWKKVRKLQTSKDNLLPLSDFSGNASGRKVTSRN